MTVAAILQKKGSAVKTILSTETVWALSQRLRAENVGAMVVVRADRSEEIEGIVSERDIARGLAEHGSTLPGMPVSSLMTRGVITCLATDTLATVARTMTQRRIRHVPVTENGKLLGLVSIGDVLSLRLDEMQQEVNVLRDYAIARS